MLLHLLFPAGTAMKRKSAAVGFCQVISMACALSGPEQHAHKAWLGFKNRIKHRTEPWHSGTRRDRKKPGGLVDSVVNRFSGVVF